MSTRGQAVRGGGAIRFHERERPKPAKGPGIWFVLLVLLLMSWVLALGGIFLYQDTYQGRIYLGVHASGIDLGAYTKDEARAVLTSSYQRYAVRPLTLRAGDQKWEATPAELGMQFDVEATVDSAYSFGREGGLVGAFRSQLSAYRHGAEAKAPSVRLQDAPTRAFLIRLESRVNRPMKEPQVALGSNLKVDISAPQPGSKLNIDKSMELIQSQVQSLSGEPIELVVEDVSPRTAEADLVALGQMAEKALAQPMQARYEDHTWTLERQDLAKLLVFKLPTAKDGSPQLSLDRSKVEDWLHGIAKEIDRSSQNARFEYAGPNQLKVIRNSVEGRKLEVAKAADAFDAQFMGDSRTVDLPVTAVKPKVADSDADKLGIRELIVEASTAYGPGIPERLHNIELAASLLNGVVVLPGEVFSFNDELGPATLEAGFQTGWGIYSTGDGQVGTVPTVAGGICQVSTTLFQSVFWAGYSIEERHWHFYWIPRYGQPPRGMQGLDATIDQALDKEGKKVLGGLDLKFRNTGGDPLLVQARTDGATLYFDLYGVKPGWEVKVDGPTITDVIKSNPETVRQDEPTMPEGQTLQVETAHDGFTAAIVRTVLMQGHEVEKKEFVSKYQPSRNVVLVGTKPAQ